MINIDKWVGAYKVRSFNWIDGKRIYFNVLYYTPGQSINKAPAWDKTIYITDNAEGQKIVSEFTHSLVEHVAKMEIQSKDETTITCTETGVM